MTRRDQPVPSHRRRDPVGLLYRAYWRAWQQAFFWTMTLGYRYRCWGRRLVPKEGGLLLVSNHQSFFDPFLATLPLPRHCSYLARDTLFRGPFGAIIRSLGAFPVRRGQADISAIKETLRRLRDGRAVLIFPEGTRSRSARMGPIQPGVAMMARKAAVPVMPVAICGASDAWPRGSLLPRGGEIHVKFGPPMQPGEVADMDDAALASELQSRITALMADLAALRDHRRRY
ncbi:MAG: hypothetical protein BIFFINMI_03373 [Phycisphaerae bacterium]|nr:hypothetical protein [Phycisphaerae bacterium]